MAAVYNLKSGMKRVTPRSIAQILSQQPAIAH
jgi:hypothetical protein